MKINILLQLFRLSMQIGPKPSPFLPEVCFFPVFLFPRYVLVLHSCIEAWGVLQLFQRSTFMSGQQLFCRRFFSLHNRVIDCAFVLPCVKNLFRSKKMPLTSKLLLPLPRSNFVKSFYCQAFMFIKSHYR